MWSYKEYSKDKKIDIIFNKTAVLEIEGVELDYFKGAILTLQKSDPEDYEEALQELIDEYYTIRESICADCKEKFYDCMIDKTCGKLTPIVN